MTVENPTQWYPAAYSDIDNEADRQLPADARRMIERWLELGRPYIELEPGVIISNLERWLNNNPPARGVCLARVREYLYVETHGVGGMAA